jgi:hypothetical protein
VALELLLKLLTVLGLAAIELWAAIPAGLALRLPPVAVGVTAALGAMVSSTAVVLLGERLRAWLMARHGGKEGQGRNGLIQRIWQRYGVIGLGLLAPLLTGAPLGAALGLALGAPAGRLLFWISLGAIFWSIAITAAGALGLAGIETLSH